jgi:DNA-binding MarR family transcriptional regulator
MKKIDLHEFTLEKSRRQMWNISVKLLKSSGNITLVLHNLEKGGLVRRTRDDADRRIIRITLTKMGRVIINKILSEHVNAITEKMSILTAEEQRTHSMPSPCDLYLHPYIRESTSVIPKEPIFLVTPMQCAL